MLRYIVLTWRRGQESPISQQLIYLILLNVYWIMREQEGNPREELTSCLKKTIGYGYDFLDHQENTSDIRD